MTAAKRRVVTLALLEAQLLACASCARTWRRTHGLPRAQTGGKWDGLCPACYQRDRKQALYQRRRGHGFAGGVVPLALLEAQLLACASCARTWRRTHGLPRAQTGGKWDGLCPACYQRDRKQALYQRRRGHGFAGGVAEVARSEPVCMTECPWCHSKWAMEDGRVPVRSPGREQLCGSCWTAYKRSAAVHGWAGAQL